MNNIVQPTRISTLAFGYITTLHEEDVPLDQATHLINGPEGTYRVRPANPDSAAALESVRQEKQLAGIVGVMVRGEHSIWIEATYVAPSPAFMRGWRDHLARPEMSADAQYSHAA